MSGAMLAAPLLGRASPFLASARCWACAIGRARAASSAGRRSPLSARDDEPAPLPLVVLGRGRAVAAGSREHVDDLALLLGPVVVSQAPLDLLEVHVEVLGQVLYGDARKNSSIDGQRKFGTRFRTQGRMLREFIVHGDAELLRITVELANKKCGILGDIEN